MNGVTLPHGSQYRTENYCGAGGWHVCRPGEEVQGFMRYWKLDGYQSGTFEQVTYSSRGQRFSARLFIR
ncbi:uncharacterized protein DUF4879 [Luteibacter rhizovicinus]|uniref:Uncharacterized protein DUF4879 n=2 Tax=Luteibacter rhizovicinus TaxID=242606 RepID=A0A4R3YNN2_9GAMM|nr:uncharacterized protein DUF4879 [Luteibacter rhizovicinus]